MVAPISDGAGEQEQTMVAVAKHVWENRYRESYGRYFEDFEVGDI